jgi:hypothetical protein
MRIVRRVVLAVVLALVVSVPVSAAVMADPFGPVEVVDPGGRPGDLVYNGPVLGVDGAGGALWLGYAREAGGSDDQAAVFERCGSTWVRSLLGTPQKNWVGEGIQVAPDGTAMVVWRGDDGTGTMTHYSSVREPGGSWGAPQTIVAKDGLSTVQFEFADNGTAAAYWTDSSPNGTYVSMRAPGGTWGAPEQVVATAFNYDLALSATGDAVLLYRGDTPGYVFAKYRAAGGAWGAATEVLKNNYANTLKQLMVEFDGAGGTVALANFREFTDTIRVNVGTNGAWGATDQTLDDDGDNPPNPLFDLRGLVGLARHPEGAVAVWSRRSTSSNFNDDIVVSRLDGGTWDTPKVFDAPNRYTSASVATNAAGEILLAASLNHGSGGGFDDIHASIAPSLGDPWPAMTRISPEGTSSADFRTAVAAGGGTAFYVGWGVHRGNNDRTEIVSTKPAAATCTSTPTPTSTPTTTATPPPIATVAVTPDPVETATPDPSPDPLPVFSPSPAPAVTEAPPASPQPPAPPLAIADFTTLPAASKCVPNRKLRLQLKRPPAGYVVKAAKIKVNGKPVVALKGKRLKRPFYLRKIPKGKFTVTVSITLTTGKSLTERRRYTRCK